MDATIVNLISKSFKDILNLEVFVIDNLEEDVDYSIYIKSLYPDTFKPEDYLPYLPDFAIFNIGSGKWKFGVGENCAGVMKNGEISEPPSSELIESKEVFDDLGKCIFGLILQKIKEKYADIHYDVYLEDNK